MSASTPPPAMPRKPRRSVTERMPRGKVQLRLVTPRAEGAPVTRADCVNGPRPCLFVACSMNLWLDVSPAGSIIMNFPDVDPWDMQHSCALDVASREGVTHEVLGELLNVTRARAEQIESNALSKLGDSDVLAVFADVVMREKR